MRALLLLATGLSLLLSTVGCVSRPTLQLDAREPSVSVSPLGIKIGNNLVQIRDVLDALDDGDVPKTRVIHVFLESDVRDMKTARQLLFALRASGYTRAVLVTKRHSESYAVEKLK